MSSGLCVYVCPAARHSDLLNTQAHGQTCKCVRTLVAPRRDVHLEAARVQGPVGEVREWVDAAGGRLDLEIGDVADRL